MTGWYKEADLCAFKIAIKVTQAACDRLQAFLPGAIVKYNLKALVDALAAAEKIRPSTSRGGGGLLEAPPKICGLKQS